MEACSGRVVGRKSLLTTLLLMSVVSGLSCAGSKAVPTDSMGDAGSDTCKDSSIETPKDVPSLPQDHFLQETADCDEIENDSAGSLSDIPPENSSTIDEVSDVFDHPDHKCCDLLEVETGSSLDCTDACAEPDDVVIDSDNDSGPEVSDSCGLCAPSFQCIKGACIGPDGACDDGNDLAWDGCTSNQISAFQLAEFENTGLMGVGDPPVVSYVEDETLCLAWMGVEFPETKTVLYRCYSILDGLFTTSAPLDAQGGAYQRAPRLARTSEGKFAATWTTCFMQLNGEYVLGDPCAPFLKVFDVAGGGTTETISLAPPASFGTFLFSDVDGWADGSIVVAWEMEDVSGKGVAAAVLTGQGELATEVPLVNEHAYGDQCEPSVSILGDDKFVVTWRSYPGSTGEPAQDGSKSGVFARIVDKDGMFLSEEFQVNDITPYGQISPSVAGLGSGSFVVAFHSTELEGDLLESIVRLRRFDSLGMAMEFSMPVAPDEPSLLFGRPRVARLPGGSFVVSWIHAFSKNPPVNSVLEKYVAARVFQSDLSATTGVVRTEQVDTLGTWNDVAVAPSGDSWIVIWSMDHVPGQAEQYTVQGQRFDSDGVKLYR